MKLSYFAGAALLAAVAAPANAVTFAQFLQTNSNNALFSYTNLDSGATKKAEITGTAIPVGLSLSVPGLPADLAFALQLSDPNAAVTMTLDLVSNHGTTGAGSSRNQLFDTGTISFTRATAAAEGTGTRTNLLTIGFTNGLLSATQNNGSMTFASTGTSAITYTSDFLDFTNVLSEDFALSFSGSNPNFLAPLGSSSHSFTMSGSGTFNAEPAPVVPGVPEPASWGLMVMGFGALGASMRGRKVAKADSLA